MDFLSDSDIVNSLLKTKGGMGGGRGERGRQKT